MSPQMRKLHLNNPTFREIMRTFQKIDRKHDHQLSLNEFLNFYGLEETYFSKMIFSRMDFGHGGSLSFEEYVSSCYFIYCGVSCGLVLIIYSVSQCDRLYRFGIS
jgi:hypothetical protein